jgi:DNA ligase-1
MNFKPMLSADASGVDLSSLKYPLLVSPKLDGVRCILWEGVAYSRNAKPIRNRFVQAWAADKHNLDGELIVGSPTEGLVLNRTQSGVMSFDGEPDFSYHLFDSPNSEWREFVYRWDHVTRENVGEDRIVRVQHTLVHGPEGLQELEEDYLYEGYEGVMLRSPAGPYKHGRSTMREGYLMKLKRFTDGEGVVASIHEGEHNENEAVIDELGRTKRSSHAENKTASGMLGHMILEDGFKVSPGTMTHSERINFFAHPELLVGKTIHWRMFGYGVKDKPRFRRYYGIREDL